MARTGRGSALGGRTPLQTCPRHSARARAAETSSTKQRRSSTEVPRLACTPRTALTFSLAWLKAAMTSLLTLRTTVASRPLVEVPAGLGGAPTGRSWPGQVPPLARGTRATAAARKRRGIISDEPGTIISSREAVRENVLARGSFAVEAGLRPRAGPRHPQDPTPFHGSSPLPGQLPGRGRFMPPPNRFESLRKEKEQTKLAT